MIAKTFFGFEEILAEELKKLGAQEVEQGVRMVSFKGYKVVYVQGKSVFENSLENPETHLFFQGDQRTGIVQRNSRVVNWSKYLNANQTFVIDATVHSTYFNHSEFVSQKCKDAIVDQFRERTGQSPSIEKIHPDLRINIHIDKDQVFGSSGHFGEFLCISVGIDWQRTSPQSTKFWQRESCRFRVGTVKPISWIRCVVRELSWPKPL